MSEGVQQLSVDDIDTNDSMPELVPTEIIVSLSDDKTQAYVKLKPPINGGSTPTPEDLERALADRKIIYGVNAAVLERLANNPLYEEEILVAMGIKPIHGQNGTHTFQFNIVKNFKPKERPDGTIDFYDLDIVENVSQGQSLCIIKAPIEGTDGLTVTNQTIPYKKGKPVPSMTGKKTKLNDDGTAILSVIDGQVEFDGKKIHVNECFYVKNVDHTTGNIKVNGNLIVHGIIQQGLSVEAGGNIEVKGTVESASISASGNIILRSGITGSDLHCDGDLTSRFIENCTVFVKGSIHSEYSLNSQIRCGKCLEIKGSRSKFLGGSCLVGQDIISRDIGSVAGIKTDLELGTDPQIIERQQEIEKTIPALEKQNESLKPLIDLLQQLEAINRLSPDKKHLLENVLANRDANNAKLKLEKEELEKINETIRTRGYGRIVCTGVIYPGTHVKFGNVNMVITDSLQCASIYYAQGQIHQGSAL